MTKAPWFYRRRIWTWFFLWPASLPGVALTISAFAAAMGTGLLTGQAALAMLVFLSFVVVAFVKSAEPPAHW